MEFGKCHQLPMEFLQKLVNVMGVKVRATKRIATKSETKHIGIIIGVDMEHKKETYYVGYGTKNKGVISKASSWKSLNKGKKPTKSQMALLQIKKWKGEK